MRINFAKIRWYHRALFIFSLLSIFVALQIVQSGSFGAWRMKYGMDLRGGVCITFAARPEDLVRKVNSKLEADVKAVVARRKLVAHVHSDESGVYIEKVDENQPRLDFENTNSDWVVQAEDGNLRVTYTAESAEYHRQALLERIRSTIEARVDARGTSGISVYAKGADGIVVEAPGESDPEEFKARLGKTGRLLFTVKSEEGECIDGSLIESAQVVILDAKASDFKGRNSCAVAVTMTESGAHAMYEATKGNVGAVMEMAMEEKDEMKVFSQPVIQTPLSKSFTITNINDDRKAHEIAMMINSGALPVPLDAVEESVVGASLGSDSITLGVHSALVAITLVLFLMIMFYGWIGIVAVCALLINLALLVIFMAATGSPMTLPGIGGMALTAGTAVDANILINENLRRLRREGKEWHIVVEQGYARAFRTIMNSNLTTFIGALVMYMYGTGPVRGFAVTWSVGLAISVFVSVLLTKRVMEVLDVKVSTPR